MPWRGRSRRPKSDWRAREAATRVRQRDSWERMKAAVAAKHLNQEGTGR